MNIEEKSDRLTNVTTDIVMGNTTAEIPDLSDVEQLVKGCGDPDLQMQQHCLKKIRLLSQETDAPIDEIIACNLMPKLVELLTPNTNAELQHEAAWIICNVASGESKHSKIVVKSDAIQPLINLLKIDVADSTMESVVWTLGNLIGDSIFYRNKIVFFGVLNELMHLQQRYMDKNNNQLINQQQMKVLEIASWTLKNICLWEPLNKWEYTSIIVTQFAAYLTLVNKDIWSNVCWGLVYIIKNFEVRAINEMAKMGMLKQLIQCLTCDEWSVQRPAVLALTEVITRVDDTIAQEMTNMGILENLQVILESNMKNIVRWRTIYKVCTCVDNLLSRNRDQVVYAINKTNIISTLTTVLKDNVWITLKKQAAKAIMNALEHCNANEMQVILQPDLMLSLFDLLDISETNEKGKEALLKIMQILKTAVLSK